MEPSTRLEQSLAWLRKMLRFPYRRFVIDSDLPREIAILRIRGIVVPRGPLSFWLFRTNKLFAGIVTSDRFKIMRIRPFHIFSINKCPVVVEGIPEPSPLGTRIRITIRMVLIHAGMLAVWFIGALFVATSAAVGSLSSNHLKAFRGFPWLFMFGIFAFVYGSGCVSFNLEANRVQALLEEALRAEPSARVREVIEDVAPKKLCQFV